jgi:hypothetical protein
VAVVGRGATFEGIQCGDHYFVWTAAWQIVAMANQCRVAARDDAAVSPQSIRLFDRLRRLELRTRTRARHPMAQPRRGG